MGQGAEQHSTTGALGPDLTQSGKDSHKTLRFGSCLMFNTLYKYFERGERKKKQIQPAKKNPSHQQNLIFNSYENLNLILQLLHVSNPDIQIPSSLVLLGYPYATRDFIDLKGHYPAVSAVFQAASFISIGLFRERIIACCQQGVTEHSSLSVMICH